MWPTVRRGSFTKESSQRHQLASAIESPKPLCGHVLLARLDVAEAEAAGAVLQHVEEAAGPLEGEDASGGADDLGEVGGGEARAGADVEDALAGADAGAAEGVEHLRPPDAVLEAEPRHFFVVGPEDVVAFAHRSASAGAAGGLNPYLATEFLREISRGGGPPAGGGGGGTFA
jgi:hypothetical protein